MGLTAGVELVTAAEVAAITHEYDFGGPDDAGGASFSNARATATTFIIVDLKARDSIDPAKVSNTSDLKLAAAFKAAVLILGSLPQTDEIKEKVERYSKVYEDQIAKYRFESTDAADALPYRGEKGLPIFVHRDPQSRVDPRGTADTFYIDE